MIKYYIPLKSDIRPSRMDYAPIFSTKLLFQIWNEGLSFAVNLGKRSFPPLFKNQNSGRFSLCSYRVVQSRVFCWTSVDHRCNLCNIPLDAATFFFLFWKICNITSIPFLLLLLSSRESILCPAGGKLTSRLQLNKSAKWRGLEDKKKEKKKERCWNASIRKPRRSFETWRGGKQRSL